MDLFTQVRRCLLSNPLETGTKLAA